MEVLDSVGALQQRIQTLKKAGHRIGFVPTMGALHTGHTSLVERSRSLGLKTVASIFVNPTQFNDPADLAKYPRTPEQDIALLTAHGADLLFMPPVSEVYPAGLDTAVQLDFSPLDSVLEGQFRPGHFKGMATVVWRLLNIVQPDVLLMGQKDFQQAAIVAMMLKLMQSPIELVTCPTSREADGLAKSSRNVRLDANARALAPLIYRALLETRRVYLETSDVHLAEQAGLRLLPVTVFRTEYLSICEADSLQPITDPEMAIKPVALVATWLGGVRLIDNLVFDALPHEPVI
jgi:pantoate--beta-alanine ligase